MELTISCNTHFGRDTLSEGAFSQTQLSMGLSHNYYARISYKLKK